MAILHQMQLSGNCYKMRLAARQTGFPIQLKEYPMLDGLTRGPEFLAKNPNGRVPLLEFDDGRCLAESDAILWHVSEGAPLQPDDAWGRAEALQWMFFEQYSHEPNIARARFWLNFAPKEALETKRALAPGWLEEGNAALGVMNAHLAQHEWFAGGRYSVADIALYGYTHCADEGGFDLARYPAVTRWIASVQAQPGTFRCRRLGSIRTSRRQRLRASAPRTCADSRSDPKRALQPSRRPVRLQGELRHDLDAVTGRVGAVVAPEHPEDAANRRQRGEEHKA